MGKLAVTILLVFAMYESCRALDWICFLPKDDGPGRAAFRRYYYNILTGKCEMFLYGDSVGMLTTLRL